MTGKEECSRIARMASIYDRLGIYATALLLMGLGCLVSREFLTLEN